LVDFKQAHITARSSQHGDQNSIGHHIFRFNEGGKILEHWDALQTMPQHVAHTNGMF